MRELRQGKIEGKIYLFPVPVEKNRKYLIFCSTEAEAVKIEEAVRTGKVTHPDLISDDFIFLTYHSDKQTKIFVMNPNRS
ncbi:hypothetical protein [Peredibacter starrii]|uniref:Uncharacterized protein n=1 Tax=Peredibacter starrii TaxID=28202 RepID=A0AAX4HUG4_9BACT|nr:hypothetical protein [Peredibacter starrii]WPU66594.1 hypothetical protein SOO65_07535 [Peredibacter starrii]